MSSSFFKQEFTFDRIARMLVLALLVALIIWAVQAIWSIILPFLLAGIFAYVVMPLVRFFQYTLRLRSRSLAVVLTLISLGAVVTLGIIYVIPSINAEIEKTIQVISGYNGGKDLLSLILPKQVRQYLTGSINWGSFSHGMSMEKALENIKIVTDQLGSIINGTLSFFSWSLVFVVGIIYFIFILLDFENLGRGFVSLFPKGSRSVVRSICQDLDRYMNSYFRGQALVSFSVAILLTIGFNIVGLPLATAMGIFIGLLNFIPYMQALGIIPLGLACTDWAECLRLPPTWLWRTDDRTDNSGYVHRASHYGEDHGDASFSHPTGALYLGIPLRFLRDADSSTCDDVPLHTLSSVRLGGGA